MKQETLLQIALSAAVEAGEAIMKIYTHPDLDWEVERKADNSPLTLADRRSHAVIAQALDRNQGNRSRTASELGISRRALLYKLHELNLDAGDCADSVALCE